MAPGDRDPSVTAQIDPFWHPYPCNHCYCEVSYKTDHLQCCKCMDDRHKKFIEATG